MSDPLNWHEGNSRYLSAALLWLRACLECRASQLPDPAQHLLPISQPVEPGRSFSRGFLKGGERTSPPMRKLLPPPANTHVSPLAGGAAAALTRAADEMNQPPAVRSRAPRLRSC